MEDTCANQERQDRELEMAARARARRRSSQGHDQRAAADHSEHLLLESPLAYLAPADEDSNMARELLAALRRHDQRELLMDAASGRRWTAAQMLATCGRLASGLVHRCELRPNQVVLTLCDHTDHEVLLALAVVLAGGALFGSSPSDGLEETRALCELVPPQLVVAPSRLEPLVRQLRRQVAGMATCRVVWMDGAPSEDPNNNQEEPDELVKAASFAELVASELDEQLLDELASCGIRARDHVLTYMLTSGSSSRPKVVPSTHLELVHGLASMVSATRGPDPLLPVSGSSVLAGDLPLDHGAGVNTMFLGVVLGAKLVVMPSYQADAFWAAVEKHRVTASIASTSFAYKLLRRLEEAPANRWDVSSLEMLACCGSKLAFHELVRQVQLRQPRLQVCQCYGATEIGFISMQRPREAAEHLDSVGHLFPGVRARVVDPNSGRALGAGERGQLHVWARSLFQGYRCAAGDDARKHLAACHDPEGFYKTGDQVEYDRHERLYVLGRLKDTLCLAEDWKVLPAELERLVDRHPLVAQSAVVGVADPELPGFDAPRAFVRLHAPDSAPARALAHLELGARYLAGELEWVAADIVRFVGERAARPKQLRGGLRIVRELPTVGLLGKLDRRALRELA